jgi:hypothetical protein
LLCIREATVPVKDRSAVSVFFASATMTNGVAVRGSAARASRPDVSEIRKKAAAAAAAAAIATEARAYLRFILSSLLDERSE